MLVRYIADGAEIPISLHEYDSRFSRERAQKRIYGIAQGHSLGYVTALRGNTFRKLVERDARAVFTALFGFSFTQAVERSIARELAEICCEIFGILRRNTVPCADIRVGNAFFGIFLA